jgi:hypothetical protein
MVCSSSEGDGSDGFIEVPVANGSVPLPGPRCSSPFQIKFPSSGESLASALDCQPLVLLLFA